MYENMFWAFNKKNFSLKKYLFDKNRNLKINLTIEQNFYILNSAYVVGEGFHPQN